MLYLSCSYLQCTSSQIKALYKKRWNAEAFHKTIKSNTGLAKSLSQITLTLGNHVFMSIY